MINNQHLLILSFFLSFNLAMKSTVNQEPVLQGMFDRVQNQINQPKHCGEKIVEMYLKDTRGMDRSELATPQIHAMCPKLVDTCCSLDQVTQIHEKVKESFDKNTTVLTHITNLVDQIASVSEEQINNIILKKQELEQKEREEQRKYYSEDSQEEVNSQSSSHNSEQEPVETEEQKEFREVMAYFNQNQDQIKENISLPYMAYNRFAARYGCTICDAESQNAFRDLRSNKPKRQYDVSMCKSFYDDSDAVLIGRMTYEFFQINRVFYFLGKNNKDFKARTHSNELIEDEENVKLFELSIKKCNEDLNWKTNSNCLKGCSNLNFLNGNYLGKFQGNLFFFNMIAPFAFHLDQEFNLEENIEKLRPEIEKLSVRFFIYPEGSVKRKLESLDNSYEYGTGWNLAKHTFVPNPLEVSDTDSSLSPDALLRGMKSSSNFAGKLSAFALALITFLII